MSVNYLNNIKTFISVFVGNKEGQMNCLSGLTAQGGADGAFILQISLTALRTVASLVSTAPVLYKTSRLQQKNVELHKESAWM